MSEQQQAIHVRVKALFADARELPPERRAAFVEQGAAGDEEVRSRVMGLLAALDGPEPFLRDPTAGPTENDAAPTINTSPLREGPGTRIGPRARIPYRVLAISGPSSS